MSTSILKKWRSKMQRGKPSLRKGSLVSQANRDALGSLPFEIWDIVHSYLDVHDRASLALSCHHMYDTVGPEVWEELKSDKRQRYQFLVIAQDRYYPTHHLCYDCACFHPGAVEIRQQYTATPASDWCNPSRVLKPIDPCPAHAKDPNSTKLLHDFVLFDADEGHVPWWLVQQIMRGHRLGTKYGLSAGTLNRKDKKSTGRIAACVNGSRGKIVEGKLLARVSTVGPFNSKLEQPNWDDIVRNTHCCGHFFRGPSIQKACNAALKDMRSKGPGFSPLYRCSYCPMELQIKIKRARDHELSSARHTYGGMAPGHVVIVERYYDLGRGIFPDDDEWVGVTRSWKNAKRGAKNTRSIKARFEGTDRDERTLMLGANDGNEALSAMMTSLG